MEKAKFWQPKDHHDRHEFAVYAKYDYWHIKVSTFREKLETKMMNKAVQQ